MNALLVELKTRARLSLNTLRRAERELQPGQASSLIQPSATPRRLRDCLAQAARGAGFSHWAHARRVLGGLAGRGDDMGSFWHAPSCGALLNHWFADYSQARAFLDQAQGRVLLPYRNQFVVVGPEYLTEIQVSANLPHWRAAGCDLVASYGSQAWLALSRTRLDAPRHSWGAIERV